MAARAARPGAHGAARPLAGERLSRAAGARAARTLRVVLAAAAAAARARRATRGGIVAGRRPWSWTTTAAATTATCRRWVAVVHGGRGRRARKRTRRTPGRRRGTRAAASRPLGRRGGDGAPGRVLVPVEGRDGPLVVPRAGEEEGDVPARLRGLAAQPQGLQLARRVVDVPAPEVVTPRAGDGVPRHVARRRVRLVHLEARDRARGAPPGHGLARDEGEARADAVPRLDGDEVPVARRQPRQRGPTAGRESRDQQEGARLVPVPVVDVVLRYRVAVGPRGGVPRDVDAVGGGVCLDVHVRPRGGRLGVCRGREPSGPVALAVPCRRPDAHLVRPAVAGPSCVPAVALHRPGREVERGAAVDVVVDLVFIGSVDYVFARGSAIIIIITLPGHEQ